QQQCVDLYTSWMVRFGECDATAAAQYYGSCYHKRCGGAKCALTRRWRYDCGSVDGYRDGRGGSRAQVQDHLHHEQPVGYWRLADHRKLTGNIRAKRSPRVTRVYTIAVQCADVSGDVIIGTVSVTVL
ncbi:MAG: hypothetical protein ACKVQK_12820, partial [Burkholderiales bacterium]